MQVKDMETGNMMWIDSSDKQTREQYKTWFEKNLAAAKQTFTRCGSEFLSIETMDNYTKALLKAFKKRK